MTQEQFFDRYKYDRTKDRIGGGGFGNVYKVFDTIENEIVALKIAEVKQGQEAVSLQKEVELASSLKRHVNIARYSACYRFDLPNGHFDFGILQYYPLGNLSQLVKSKKLTFEEKEQIAKGVISGINHLHENSVVHRDLKSANILISEGYQGEYVPKIADFGLSKQFAQNENSYFSNSFTGGSLLYVAPEQLEGKELRKNVDLWSLGVVLYELFTGETPFRASVDEGSETARAEIIRKIRTATIPSALNTVPAKWQEVIRGCLVPDPSKRMKSIEEVMSKVGIKSSSTSDTVVDPVPPKYKLPKTKDDPKPISKWLYYIIGCLMVVVIAVTVGGIPTWVEADIVPNSVKMISIPGKNLKMSETEVTIAQYLEFCKATNSHWPEWLEKGNEFNIYTGSDYYYKKKGMSESNVNHPVTGVSALDADAFCQWMGGRLPTESEWEYAAKGGESYYYSGSNNLNEVGWYANNSGGKAKRVKQKGANGYGLYDMSGNVLEWTSSKDGEWTSSKDVAYRVLRGGCYLFIAEACQISNRNSFWPDYRDKDLGFRLAMSQ